VISGYFHGVNEICALVGYCAVQNGSSNYHSVLHKFPEECRFEAQSYFFHVEPPFSLQKHEKPPLTVQQIFVFIVLGQSDAPV
jgi:hypothetical protein